MTAPIGLHCVGCGKGKLMTIDSRPARGGIRRRKECNKCGFRVTTIETVVGYRKARQKRRLAPLEDA